MNSILKSCFIQLVKVTNVNVLKKTKLKKIGKKLNYNLLPKSFIKDDLDLMPLTFKKTMILGSNENNYYPYFLTDRYGFLNDDNHYNQDFQDILIIGDSYAMGGTVNYKDTCKVNFQKKVLKLFHMEWEVTGL